MRNTMPKHIQRKAFSSRESCPWCLGGEKVMKKTTPHARQAGQQARAVSFPPAREVGRDGIPLRPALPGSKSSLSIGPGGVIQNGDHQTAGPFFSGRARVQVRTALGCVL